MTNKMTESTAGGPPPRSARRGDGGGQGHGLVHVCPRAWLFLATALPFPRIEFRRWFSRCE